MEKLNIPVYKGSALLVQQANNFSNGRNELILQPVFLSAKMDCRYPLGPLGRHLYQSIAYCTDYLNMPWAGQSARANMKLTLAVLKITGLADDIGLNREWMWTAE